MEFFGTLWNFLELDGTLSQFIAFMELYETSNTKIPTSTFFEPFPYSFNL